MVFDGDAIHKDIDSSSQKGYDEDGFESVPSLPVLFTHALVPVSAGV